MTQKISEEIKEEINRIIIGNKNSCENDIKFFSDKIKTSNKKLQKDIKQYICLNNDNGINESMKSKSLLSRLGDAMLIAPEYFVIFNSFDDDEDDKTKKKNDDDNYNKDSDNKSGKKNTKYKIGKADDDKKKENPKKKDDDDFSDGDDEDVFGKD